MEFPQYVCTYGWCKKRTINREIHGHRCIAHLPDEGLRRCSGIYQYIAVMLKHSKV